MVNISLSIRKSTQNETRPHGNFNLDKLNYPPSYYCDLEQYELDMRGFFANGLSAIEIE